MTLILDRLVIMKTRQERSFDRNVDLRFCGITYNTIACKNINVGSNVGQISFFKHTGCICLILLNYWPRIRALYLKRKLIKETFKFSYFGSSLPFNFHCYSGLTSQCLVVEKVYKLWAIYRKTNTSGGTLLTLESGVQGLPWKKRQNMDKVQRNPET